MRVAYIGGLAFLLAICIVSGFAAPAPGRELVGIVPFTNQRDDSAVDWLGFYIQARLQAGLAAGCDCDFHTLNTTRLWQIKAQPSVPISVRTTILVTGSFQIVLEQGIIEARIRRFSPENSVKEFSITFGKPELETKLDQLASTLAHWINPHKKSALGLHYPRHSENLVKLVLHLRQQLYHPGQLPETNDLTALKLEIKPESPAEFVADLAEGMIIVASRLPESESKPMLAEAERLLRSSAAVHTQNARILGLLAETFYLNKSDSAWVEQAAEQAILLNENDELSWLIQVLVAGEATEKGTQGIKKINDINPWIWPDVVKEPDTAQFQKGVFKYQLLILKKSLN